MRRAWVIQLLIVVFTLTFISGCQVIEGIFKAGMWVGIIIVVLVIALIIFLLKKIF